MSENGGFLSLFTSAPLWLRLALTLIPIGITVFMWDSGYVSPKLFLVAYGAIFAAYLIPLDTIPDLVLDEQIERDCYIALEDYRNKQEARERLLENVRYSESAVDAAIKSIEKKTLEPQRLLMLGNFISSLIYSALLYSFWHLYEFEFALKYVYIALAFTSILFLRYILLIGKIET